MTAERHQLDMKKKKKQRMDASSFGNGRQGDVGKKRFVGDAMTTSLATTCKVDLTTIFAVIFRGCWAELCSVLLAVKK